MDKLPKDVLEKLTADFGARSRDAGRALEKYLVENPDESGRICRCAIHVAKGDLKRLLGALETARMDPRDLIVGAEYENGPEGSTRVRDFNEPFGRS